MAYIYAEHRPFVFTEVGQEKLFDVMRKARECLENSKAVRADILLHAAGCGNSWQNMAVVERLVELELLRVVYDKSAWQEIVYVPGKKPL